MLKKLNLKYHFFENLEDGVIIISQDGIIEDINERALNIFKYNYEEVIGKSISIMMFEKDAKYHQIYIQKYLSSRSKDLLRKGRELEGKDKFNNKILLYIYVVKHIDKDIKLIGIIRELKDHVFSELSKFKSIYLVSQEYKIACDLEGNFLDRYALCSLLGYELDDTVSNMILDFIHNNDIVKMQRIFKKIRENSEINNEVVRIMRKDGNALFFSWNSNILTTSNERNQNQHHHYVVIANDITDVIKKDEKISIFENTINENPNGILIANSEGIIEYVNEMFLKSLRLPNSSVLSKNLFNNRFFIESEIKIDIYNLIKYNGTWKGEIVLNSAEEDKKTFFITIKGIKNHENKIINYVEMIEDISTIHSIYDLIEAEKNKLNEILEVIPQGILLFDKNGKLLQLNSSILNIYFSIYKNELNLILNGKYLQNVTEKNLIIKTIKELFNSENNSRLIEPIPGKFLKILRINIQSDFIFIFYDMSNEKKVEQFRNQIVSTVSHELRTPISAIIQSLSNYIKYEDQLQMQEKNRVINIAYSNSQLLGEIVEDLLLVSQIDNNKITLVITNVNLSQVLKNIIDQFHLKIQNKNLKINYNLIDNCIVFGDLKRISQIFRILIDNAIKYSPKNSQITIDLERENNPRKGVLIQIIDEGIGISNEEIPFLFSRFFRGKNVSNIKGTGLGLSIAKSLVDEHKGNIKVLSEVSNGTTFQIFLPVNSF